MYIPLHVGDANRFCWPLAWLVHWVPLIFDWWNPILSRICSVPCSFGPPGLLGPSFCYQVQFTYKDTVSEPNKTCLHLPHGGGYTCTLCFGLRLVYPNNSVVLFRNAKCSPGLLVVLYFSIPSRFQAKRKNNLHADEMPIRTIFRWNSYTGKAGV